MIKKKKIISWDWTGINLSIESQGVNQKNKTLQFRCLNIKVNDYDII
jgi:hypothetical protein